VPNTIYVMVITDEVDAQLMETVRAFLMGVRLLGYRPGKRSPRNE
jgi:hypothetical protein